MSGDTSLPDNAMVEGGKSTSKRAFSVGGLVSLLQTINYIVILMNLNQVCGLQRGNLLPKKVEELIVINLNHTNVKQYKESLHAKRRFSSQQLKNIIKVESAYRKEDYDDMYETNSSDSDSEVEIDGQGSTLNLSDDSE